MDSYGRDLLDAGVAFNYWFFGDTKRTEDESENDPPGGGKDRPVGEPNYNQKSKSSDEKQNTITSIEKLKNKIDVTSQIGKSAEAIKGLDQFFAELTNGNPSKVLGKFGKVEGLKSGCGSIALSGVKYVNNEISAFELTFNLGTTLTSVWGGGKIGASFGGPKGYVAGVTISALGEFVVKPLYKNYFYPKVARSAEQKYNSVLSEFYNDVIFNISRYN